MPAFPPKCDMPAKASAALSASMRSPGVPRVESDDTAEAVPPNGLRVGEFGAHCRQCPGKIGRDPRRQVREEPGQAARGSAEIRPGENDPGGDDADPDLADARYRKH